MPLFSLWNKFTFPSLLLTLGLAGCFNTEKKVTTTDQPPLGFSIKGISLVAPVNEITDADLLPIMQVNANSIAIMPYAFCSQKNPIVRYNHHGQWWGETDEGVIQTILLAHRQHLSVMLKPHLWLDRGAYTGALTFETEDQWRQWEESYRDYALHFAKIADSMKVEIYCFATELGAAVNARPKYWSALVDTLKKVYHGQLTYAANWDDYTKFPFWNKLDYIGIDAYFPLSGEEDPGIEILKKGWEKHVALLGAESRKYDKKVLFTEYGYRNANFTAAEPWKESESPENNAAQSAAYEAFFQTFSTKQWFAGGYLWKWYVGNDRHHQRNPDFSPQNKPAEKILRDWYSK